MPSADVFRVRINACRVPVNEDAKSLAVLEMVSTQMMQWC